ncbi:MAG: hypothetical protein ACK5IJ_08685 [Mangrovibacterium sp.]
MESINMEFLAVLGITIVIIAIVFLGMSIRILLKKKGEFSSLHISQSKPMRDRGISCVQSQDRAEQAKERNEERLF